MKAEMKCHWLEIFKFIFPKFERLDLQKIDMQFLQDFSNNGSNWAEAGCKSTV